MRLSIFTVITSLAYFNSFVLIGTILRRKTGFLNQYSLIPLTALLVASILRLFFAFEFSFTKVVHSRIVLPFMLKVLNYEFITTYFAGARVWHLIVLIGITVSLTLLALYIRKLLSLYTSINNLSFIPDSHTKSLVKNFITVKNPSLKYRLIISPDIDMPMTVGYFQPIFLLPKHATNYSDTEIQYIIQHELKHFTHKDMWIKTFINVLICLLWWNPFVYLLKADLEQILEVNCDLQVTRHMTDNEKASYLQVILKSIQSAQGMRQAITTPYAQKLAGTCHDTDVYQRFHMVGKYDWKRSNRGAIIFIVTTCLLFILSFTVIVQPYILPTFIEPDFSDDSTVLISTTPENAYILVGDDNHYYLYIDGELWEEIEESELNSRPYSSLQIKNNN